jgi:chorismate mutase
MKLDPIRTNNDKPLIISGPCSAETEEQLVDTSELLAKTGKVDVIRAGIWKPRTRPGNFEGVGSVGLEWMQKVKEKTGLPIAVEVANFNHVFNALKYKVDILWIGARTTVNPFAVQEIADALQGVDATVFVKNPINPDLELWVGAFERLNSAGVTKLAAVHRGFASYGNSKYRNEPQWQIPIELKRRFPDLPIICDPSHICGNRDGLASVSQRALDLDFDGLMLESHIDPDEAWSDKKQQVTPAALRTLIDGLVFRHPDPEDPEITHNLESLRNEINEIDDDLLQLLSTRMKVAERIGAYKKQNEITILQTGRWNDIIECKHGGVDNCW